MDNEKEFINSILQLVNEAGNEEWQGKESPSQLIQKTLDNYQHYWHADDKVWMKKRKELWLPILANIKQLSHKSLDFKKPEYVILKQLFFTGKFDYKKTSYSYYKLVSNLLFFYFWFFPKEPTIEIMQPLLDTHLGGISYPGDQIVSNSSECPPPYGLMGGREKLFIEVFYPKQYWKETIKVSSHSFYSSGESMEKDRAAGIHANTLMCSCCGSIKSLLINEDTNPFAFGQYLWDRFDYNYEHYFHEFYNKDNLLTQIPGIENKVIDKRLVGVLNLIIGFYEHEATLKNSSLAIDLRTLLHERFEENGFSPRLQKVWEDVKFSRESTKATSNFDWNKYTGINKISLDYEGNHGS